MPIPTSFRRPSHAVTPVSFLKWVPVRALANIWHEDAMFDADVDQQSAQALCPSSLNCGLHDCSLLLQSFLAEKPYCPQPFNLTFHLFGHCCFMSCVSASQRDADMT